jgi:hypothetical protein
MDILISENSWCRKVYLDPIFSRSLLKVSAFSNAISELISLADKFIELTNKSTEKMNEDSVLMLKEVISNNIHIEFEFSRT